MGIELTVKSMIKKTSSKIWPWRFWIRRGMFDGSKAHVLSPKSSSRFELITADIHTDATTFTDFINPRTYPYDYFSVHCFQSEKVIRWTWTLADTGAFGRISGSSRTQMVEVVGGRGHAVSKTKCNFKNIGGTKKFENLRFLTFT